MKAFLSRLGKTKTILIIVAILLVGWLIYHFAFQNKSGQYQFVTVKQGSITEEVSVTGNTTPVQELDLGFQTAGTIAAVYHNAGDQVNAGDVIARLNTSSLNAQYAQAQASVDAAQAQLASLQAGSQPADIQTSQAALAGGQQTLANSYSNVVNTLLDAEAKANDAVRNQLSPFFSGAESDNPQITFNVTDSQTANDMVNDRVQASGELNNWQNELTALGPSSSTSTLETALQNGANHLSIINNLLTTASEALIEATGISSTTLDSYKDALVTAVTDVNGGQTDISTLQQNIASEKISVEQLQAELNLKLAGSTPQAIQAQQAQVEEAQADLQGIQVQITQASLVSPISGVITVQNAKVGEIETPNPTTPLVSIISNNGLEVDSYVPETDIGKVAVGNSVSMTLDAFPDQTFTGKVFYIDPAQTVVSGVVEYGVKVSFDEPNSQIKSGLTVNLNIETQTDNNALILPQFAIIENGQNNFVEVLQNGKAVQVPVTLGIQDQSGNVEVLSGVTAGEQVINIGLKAQ